MANYLVLALESALAVFGIRSVYEQPRYNIIERIGAVEIRVYGPRLAAETTVVTAKEEAGRKTFTPSAPRSPCSRRPRVAF